MTTNLQIRLDESYDSSEIRLAKSYNPIVLKTDLDTGSGVKLVCKLAKSLTETSSKIYKPKTYDKVIDNSIYKNKWCKVIDKKLLNLDSY